MNEYQSEIYQFIQDYIIMEKPLFIEVSIKDPTRKNRLGTSRQQIYRGQR